MLSNREIEESINAAFDGFKQRTTMCRTPACKHEAEHLRSEIQQMIEAEVERRVNARHTADHQG